MTEIYECTILTCEPGRRLAKLYRDLEAPPEDYDAGHLFQAAPIACDWLAFVDSLGVLEPTECLIRGGIRHTAIDVCARGESVRRLAYDREECEAAFEERSRNWIVLDADGTDAPFDPEDVEASVRAWHASLPEQIRDARSAFFLSASAHRSPTVRGKLVVALDEAIDNATAAAFATAHGFDASVCHTVALNYFAAPVFDGCDDPLDGQRRAIQFDGAPMHVEAGVESHARAPRELGERATSGKIEADTTDRAIELAAMLADRWLDGGRIESNAWLHLAGWLLGAGWSRGEIAGMLELLDDAEPVARKRGEHRHILRNARALEGPGGAREWLGEQFEAVDALVNYDPVVAMAIAMRAERHAKQAALATVDPFRPATPYEDGGSDNNGLVLTLDKQGRPVGSCDNVLRWLEAVMGDGLRLEECSGRVTIAGCPEDWMLPDGTWTDTHTTRLRRMLDGARLAVAKDLVNDCVTAHARACAHNVLTDYAMQCAEQWDGVPRVDRAMASYWGATDDACTRAVSRVFLLSLAARALDPGCKVDTALLLIGGQGLRKSSSLKALAGAALFSDSPLPIGDKDALQVIRGKWLWEIAENASATRKDRNAVKAFLAASEDTFRASYGRFSETVPRQCCFAVSSNDAEPLNDPTGARRYLPLTLTQRIDVDAIERDREQLIGEAAWRVLDGERWWATDEEDDAMAEARHLVTEIAEVEDVWDEAVATWIDARRDAVTCALVADPDTWEPVAGPVRPFSVHDVLAEFGGAIPMPITDAGRGPQMRVAHILRRLGMRKVRATSGSRRTYLWC